MAELFMCSDGSLKKKTAEAYTGIVACLYSYLRAGMCNSLSI
jgi:hypothetical protein